MVFASDPAAFGMKSATTSRNVLGQAQQQTGQSTSSFGQTQPQQSTGASVFGQSQPNTTGGIFGQSQPQQNAGGLFRPSGGLFASTTQTQSQPQQTNNSIFGGSSLFGPTQQQQQQQQPQQTNAFGSSMTTTSNPLQPQQTSAFGSSMTTTSNPLQPQQTSNPLFGGNSIFGSTQQQQQQQQPQQTGAFGSSMTTTSNPLQPQATLPANAFGASTTTGTGGSTLFGSKPPQQQQLSLFASANQNLAQQNPLAASTPAGPPPFTKSTKFNDLPDNVKSILEAMDSHMQGRAQIRKDLQQRKLGAEPTKGHEAIRNIQKDLVNTSATIRNDLNVTQDIKTRVDQAVEDTIVATRIIDGFRNPQSGNTYLKDHAGFPLEYFSRITDQMKQRLEWYKSTIEQIERKLASAANTTQTPQSIPATLQAQHAMFITLASKTAAVDAELQKIKALYTQLWRAKTGSVRDPFGDVVKSHEKSSDFGLSQLNVR